MFKNRFRRDQPSTGALMVRVIQREGLLGVAFHCFLQQTKKQLLAKISFRQPDWLVSFSNRDLQYFYEEDISQILLQGLDHAQVTQA